MGLKRTSAPPAPGSRGGRTSISGANTSTSSCGRLRLIGQEQSWSSVWGEPARAGRALLGAEAPPGARGRSPRFACRSLSQIGGGLRPTSFVERGAEGALPPRPTDRGLQGGRAARRRRSHRDPPCRRPAAPARIPPPAPPVSPTGRGRGEALTPPETRENRI